MAKGQQQHRRARRANNRQHDQRVGQVQQIQNWLPAGFPTSQCVKMKFVQFNSNAFSSGTFTNAYQANSVFNPSVTIDTSHQPYFHDQYSGQYEFYEVLKSTIKVTFVNSTVTDAVRCVLSWSGNAAFSSNANTNAEVQDSKHCLIGSSVGASVSKSLTHTYTLAKTGGTPGASYSRTPSGTTPVDPFFWIVQCGGAASGDTGNIATDVSITYWVKWSSPVTVTGS